MDSARTCWADGMGLSAGAVEALTEIAEESGRRAGDARPELDPRDVWAAWPLALRQAGQIDLADRVDAAFATFGTSRFAAIGTDGMRPVVWGLGETEEAALAEARSEARNS